MIGSRARAEAYLHDHHKLVIVDELTHMLSSPFSFLQGSENIWDRSDVEALRALVTEPDSTAEGSQRSVCDSTWDSLLVGEDPVADGWLPAASLDEAPVELWGRVHAAHVPLFLVPSTMLGALAATDSPAASQPFEAGDAYLAKWTVSPAVSPPGHTVRLRYLTTTYTASHAPMRLSAWINGIEQPASILTSRVNSAWAHQHAVQEQIYLIDVVISPSDASGPWNRDSLGPANTVELRLTAEGLTSTAIDRVYLVWGAELVYLSAAMEELHTQPLLPTDAVGERIDGVSGLRGSCGAMGLCEDNADFLVTDLLDGITTMADIQAERPGPDWIHPSLGAAWDRFIAHTCAHLHASGPGGGPTRCLVDERTWVSDHSDLPALLDVAGSVGRLTSGVEKGDGASVTWLVMELEDMVDGVGRFGAREPLDAAYPYLAYLPRLSRNMLGEGITFEIYTGGHPSCAGEWTVSWRMPVCPAKWTYGPVGEVEVDVDEWEGRLDSLDIQAFYQLIELGTGQACGSVGGPFSGAFSVDLLPSEVGLRFGWEIKNDEDAPGTGELRTDVGFSQDDPTYVEFALRACKRTSRRGPERVIFPYGPSPPPPPP
ncbi:MAG: hypothetical protein JNM72_02400 [Deltaproteobacteria bacterium]|nr:hypothetical protein [Deltaproteobacteria bacterium]